MYTNKNRFFTQVSASILLFGTVISPIVPTYTSSVSAANRTSHIAKTYTHPTKQQLRATIAAQRNEVTRLNRLLNTIQRQATLLHQQINAQSKTGIATNGTTTIVLPKAMTASLLKAASQGRQIQTLKNVSAQGFALNHFVTNEADFDKKIKNVAKLTPAQQIEVSQFVTAMLNPVRRQLGNSPLITSANVINFANTIARGYERDNWNIFNKNAHDTKVITQAARQYGLNAGGNYYENIGAGFIPTTDTNMHQLKYGIYRTVLSMLFADASEQFGHTFSLLGTYDYMLSNGGYRGNTYFAMSFDSLGQDHFQLVPLSYSTGKFTPGTTYPGTGETRYLAANNKLTQLNNKLADTQAWFRIALQKRDRAQSTLTKAQAQLQRF